MNTPTLISLVCTAALAWCAPALAQPAPEPAPEPQPDPAPTYRHGYNLILNGNWDEARQVFDKIITSYPKSGWADDAKFWRCYAADQKRSPEEDVFACYEDLVASFDGSQWKDDAKLAMIRLADRLEQQGKIEYRERVKGFMVGDDDGVLLQVLVALGEIGDERSVDVILERMRSTTDEHLRTRIVDVLEDVNDSPRVADELARLAESDPSVRVRLAALESMGQHDSPKATALHRQIAADPDQPPQLRAQAIEHLTAHAPADLIELLRGLARDSSYQVARRAIRKLGDLGSPQALEALTGLLPDVPSVWRRLAVVEAIEDFQTDAAVAVLSDIAASDPDPRMRQAAARSLGDVETVAARDALIELLNNLDEKKASP